MKKNSSFLMRNGTVLTNIFVFISLVRFVACLIMLASFLKDLSNILISKDFPSNTLLSVDYDFVQFYRRQDYEKVLTTVQQSISEILEYLYV